MKDKPDDPPGDPESLINLTFSFIIGVVIGFIATKWWPF